MPASAVPGSHEPPKDALLEEARKIAEDHGGQISTSFLQRKLQIGYPRAARLKELLDEEFSKENQEGPLPPSEPTPTDEEEPPDQRQ
jgi:S-DNA-T family DNA segregation ATPase FtsK/SpoIIIE